jgi:hypothetical protein
VWSHAFKAFVKHVVIALFKGDQIANDFAGLRHRGVVFPEEPAHILDAGLAFGHDAVDMLMQRAPCAVRVELADFDQFCKVVLRQHEFVQLYPEIIAYFAHETRARGGSSGNIPVELTAIEIQVSRDLRDGCLERAQQTKVFGNLRQLVLFLAKNASLRASLRGLAQLSMDV